MQQNRNPKWLILTLAGITNTLAAAAPGMSLSVLFKEISSDLNLSLVQVGLIWGLSALPGIFTSLLGGVIGDRFGPRRVMLVGVILVGLTGALRGLADDFVSLLITVIVAGLLSPIVTMSNLKACGIWFPSRQLGFANGILSMGMALGFLLGSLLSATVLSPWLGGWRHVMFFYGALAVLFSIPWYFTPSVPQTTHQYRAENPAISMRQAVKHIARLKNIWLLGLTILGFGGCVQAVLGYLPLYLRGQGWTGFQADGALSAFHLTSMIFVLPIVLWSDRLRARKKLLIGMGLMAALGIGVLSVADGFIVWGADLLSGLVRDGFMALLMTLIVETRGVGPTYAGTATGFTMIFAGLGNVLAPPLGNKLAEISPGLSFVFWAALAVFGVICLSFTSASQPGSALQPVDLLDAENNS